MKFGPRRRAVAVIGCALVVSGGCSASTGSAASTHSSDNHQCVVPRSARPHVSWSALKNPVLSYPTAGVKDQALVWAGGRWHMLFSYVTNDVPTPGAEHWSIGTATSADLSHWSAPALWPDQPGTLGVVSPDLVRSPSGVYVVTYESNPGEVGGGQDKMYYRTSTDLEHWGRPHPLALSLHPAPQDRMIDPSLAWVGHGLIIGYKYGVAGAGQHFEVAWSPSGSLDGPWVYVGRPDIQVYGDTVENLEFLTAAGQWQLVATTNTLDQPWIFTLVGDPSRPSSWLHWTDGRELQVPSESWNTGPGVSSVGYEHANSAFICDATAQDGYYYLTYAGSDELTHFGGWGHAKIGMARSRDLVHWQVPG